MDVDLGLADHYDRYYKGTSKWRELSAADKARNLITLLSQVGLPLAGRVVDIGCGEGAVVERLSGLGFDVDGFDISRSAIEAAHSRPGRFAAFDGSRLPVEDKTYDLAVLSHVVEHLEHPRVLLSEAQRVARRVYVEVPLELTWRTPEHFAWTDLGHINLYSALTIRHLVESTGLNIEAERTFESSWDVIRHAQPVPKAAFRWAIRRAAYRLSPALAQRVFVYHHGLLGRPE